MYCKHCIGEGSFELKLPTIWTDAKQKWAEAERRERVEERSVEEMREKGGKVAKHSVFPMICGSGGSKSKFAKVAAAEPAGQMRHEKVHAVAVVARSTCRSQNGKNIRCLDHFWRSRKVA